MTVQSISAVFENGRFRPVRPLGQSFAEGQQVRLVVETDLSPEEILDLAGQVYDGLSDEEIDEIERIALDRGNFFSNDE